MSHRNLILLTIVGFFAFSNINAEAKFDNKTDKTLIVHFHVNNRFNNILSQHWIKQKYSPELKYNPDGTSTPTGKINIWQLKEGFLLDLYTEGKEWISKVDRIKIYKTTSNHSTILGDFTSPDVCLFDVRLKPKKRSVLTYNGKDLDIKQV